MRALSVLVPLTLLALLFAGRALAANATATLELPEMLVTASRVPEPETNTARNVTVLTAEDLARTPGDTLADALGRLPGVQVRQALGGAKGAVADLRGMGDTAVSNVLVVLDGVRMNAPDLSGPDLSAIPLSMVERIEVVRGPSAVAWGDGAVGGVIQIFTHKPGQEPRGELRAEAGSFGTWRTQAQASAGGGPWSFSFQAGAGDTDGFRENAFHESRDLHLAIGLAPEDLPRAVEGLDVKLRLALHEDAYGLPGPLSREEALSGDGREGSDFPEDQGETRDLRLGLDLSLPLQGGDWGELRLTLGRRDRQNDYVLGYSPLLSWDAQESSISDESLEALATWRKAWDWLGREQSLTLGAEARENDYSREDPAGRERHLSLVRRWAGFALFESELAADLRLRLGARHETLDGRFRRDQLKNAGGADYWAAGEEYDRTWDNQAYEAGLTWAPLNELEFYLAAARSFRSPNVDELALADEDLSPQVGWHLESGATWRPLDGLSLSAGVFWMLVDDEIYYGEDPDTGERFNRNYDERTERLGLELSTDWLALDELRLFASATLLRARFEDGERVPLVAEQTATAGAEWELLQGLWLRLEGEFSGERLDGNDLEGDRYHKLEAHALANLGLRFERGDFKAFAGIKNVTDESYATAAYSEATYPMAGRSWYAGLAWNF